MRTLRRMAWQRWPSPIERESPSPEMPMYVSSRLAAIAPEAMAAMRPCAELKPCALLTKYAGVFDEQPMPLIFAMLCGTMDNSQSARTIAAVIESCPHPAHNVDMEPS